MKTKFITIFRKSKNIYAKIATVENFFGEINCRWDKFLWLTQLHLFSCCPFLWREKIDSIFFVWVLKTFSFRRVLSREVFDDIKSLKMTKQICICSVPAWSFKGGMSVIVPDLAPICYYSIPEWNVPSKLKNCIVTPRYEKDNPLNSSDYTRLQLLAAFLRFLKKRVKLIITFLV